MKNIFTALLSTLLTLSVFAAGFTGRVSVSVNGDDKYQVFIDGRNVYSGSSLVYLNNIQPGRHTIEVYRLINYRQRSNRPVFRDEFTFRPRYDLNIIVGRNGYTRFSEDRNGNDNRNDRNDKNDKDNNKYGYKHNKGYGRDRDDNDDDRWDSNRNNRNNDWGNRGRDDNDRRWDRNDNNGNYGNNNNKAISDADFNQVLQKIRNQWFGKLNEARSAVQGNYFTSSQIKQILQLFNADGDKLELAKLAYTNVVDQRNYTQQLYDVLSASSRNELENYIRNYRNPDVR